MTTKNTHQPATGALAERARLSTEIADLTFEISELAADVAAADLAISEAEHALNEAIGHARTRKDPDGDIRRARHALEEAGEHHAHKTEALALLKDRRQRAREALHTLAAGSLEEILAAQQQAEDARGVVERLEGLIAEHQAKLDEVTDPEDVEIERERVLAAIALGEADEQALQALEQPHKAAELATEERRRTLALVRGLKQRLDLAKDEAAQREQEHRALLSGYLKGKMQNAAAQYISAAKKAFTHFGAVVGYSRLLDAVDPATKLIGNAETGFPLVLSPIKGAGAEQLKELVDDGDFRAKALTTARHQLEEQGIILPACV